MDLRRSRFQRGLPPREGVAERLELHEAWEEVKAKVPSTSGEGPGVRGKNQGDHGDRDGTPRAGRRGFRQSNLYGASCTGINLEFFEYVAYPARNDYLGGWYPPGHPVRSTEYLVHPKLEGKRPAIFADAYEVSSADELYWPVGRSGIEFRRPLDGPEPGVEVGLVTWTPNFSHFEVSTDGKTWSAVEGSSFPWRLTAEKNTLAVRSVNLAGLRGEENRSIIRVTKRKEEEATGNHELHKSHE